MAEIHDLLTQHGKQSLAGTTDRRAVEAAAAYMADEDATIGFIYSGWCQTALPHKRLGDGEGWQVRAESITLVIEPGMRSSQGLNERPVSVGVPYGSRARLILLYLQSEAVRTNSPEVELGPSLRVWLSRLGIPAGGKSIREVREQAERLSRCRITFELRMGKRMSLLNHSIIESALFDEGDDGAVFAQTATLSQSYYEMLRRHPVPLEDAAVRALTNNSLALDVYCWLAYRLHILTKARPVSWEALKAQFGHGYGRLDHFRTRFRDALTLALAVYPDARVGIAADYVTLMPSPPPVAKTLIAIAAPA
jgi:hypothetical protein